MTASPGAAEPPEVSVVIVNWNSKELLDGALRSLYERTKTVTFETIVVDNGSADGSAEHIRSAWPGVQLIALDSNHGFGAANNIAFKECRGKYVLVLNPDTVVFDTTVSGLIECMEEHPEAGCAGARHLNPDGSLQWSMDDFPRLLNDTLRYTDAYRIPVVGPLLRSRYPAFSAHDTEREVGWVNGACMLVRREVIESVGGFDEYFFIFAEELDWCRRMWEAGWTVRFSPRAELIHMLGGTFMSVDGRRTVLIYQSLLRYYRKHYSPAKYRAVRTMVQVNAAARLAVLGGMNLAELAGVPRNPRLWELVTQQPQMAPWRDMYRSWRHVIWVRPEDDLRPT